MIPRDYKTAIRLSQAQEIIGCSKRTLYRPRDEGLLVTWPVSPDGRERRTSAGHAMDAREALTRLNPPPNRSQHSAQPHSRAADIPRQAPKTQAELSRSLYR